MRVHIEAMNSSNPEERQGVRFALGLTAGECRTLAATLNALATDTKENARCYKLALGPIEIIRVEESLVHIPKPHLSVVPNEPA